MESLRDFVKGVPLKNFRLQVPPECDNVVSDVGEIKSEKVKEFVFRFKNRWREEVLCCDLLKKL